jgi:hypothetical protein
MKKALLLLISSLLIVLNAQAVHTLGGSITWQCLSNGDYHFTLTLYRDCAAANFSSTQTIYTSYGTTINCTRVSSTYLNKDCNAPDCNSVGGSYLGAVQKQVFRSQPVTLPAITPASGLNFSWFNCCRANYTNLANPTSLQTALSVAMFPLSTHAGAPSSLINNSSPQFLEEPDFTFCTNTSKKLVASAFDIDADSLYYNWKPAYENSFQSVPYAFGYSSIQPFGTSATANLDNITGIVDVNVGNIGLYAVNIEVEEWRCGQLISRTAREVPIFVKPCTTPSGLCGNLANNQPTVSFSYPPNTNDTLVPVLNTNNVVRYYEMEVAPNTPIEITMQALDPDLEPNCAAQSITFSGQSPFLYQGPGYDSICALSGNCASITSNNANGSFISSISNSVTFNWTPNCNPGGNIPQWCANSNNEFDFYFKFEDNACNYPKSTEFLVRIRVNNNLSKPSITTVQSPICPNDSTTLTASAGYANYLWSTGDTTSSIMASPGTYWVQASDNLGCQAVDTATVLPILPYTTEPILCLVSYDYALGRNVISWEAPSKKGVINYTIYRVDSAGAVLIGTKGVNAANTFVDSTSVPHVEYQYYLGIHDSCGLEYQNPISAHRNIILNATRLGSGLRLSWPQYANRTPTKYLIYRSTGITSPFLLIDSTVSSFPVYLDDPLPQAGFLRYQVAAVFDTCEIIGEPDVYKALSNVLTYNWFGEDEYSISDFEIAPNPTSGIFTVKTTINARYALYSLQGRRLLSDQPLNQRIDISHLPDGMYILSIMPVSGNQTLHYRIIKTANH